MKEQEVDIAHLEGRLREVVQEASREQIAYIVTTSGQPDVVIIPYAQYVRWRAVEKSFLDRFDQMLERLDAHNRCYSEEEVAADVAEAIAEARG